MSLQKISLKERNEVADLLARYWKSRGMLQYNAKWAKDYLTKGHGKEIKRDEFFVFREGKEIIGNFTGGSGIGVAAGTSRDDGRLA